MRKQEGTAAVDSTVHGAPLETIEHLVGGPRVDDLLTRAARRAPGKPALVTAAGVLSFADLDERATRCASAITDLAGPATGEEASRQVVAIATTLDPAFGIAFFGIARSGHIPALINPLLREEGLVHVLRTSGASIAIVPPEVHRRLAAVRDRLPGLRHTILNGDDGLGPEPGVPLFSELIERAVDGAAGGMPDGPGGDEEEVACIQFTSGSTGAPKAVLLSHRNVTLNAAQSAYAHRLDARSVLFNNLPTFHLMHLTMGVTVGATHVLWPEEDAAEAVEACARHRGTHYYSLPVRLSRLAADPRLPTLEAPSLRAFLCGGSALPVTTTSTLLQHFGVAVAQGYGLQETSPSTHFDDLDDPVIRSSGRPVVGTGCRIVAVESRDVLPRGEKGEIQVRGPQLMKGYLGRDSSRVVDPGGWFSTGDVGYVDEAGRLFVVDRIKDVFKRDNWLVSPTEIERVLLRHPGVRDCVVFDHPDDFSGAVAHALVVPETGHGNGAAGAVNGNGEGPGEPGVRAEELAAYVAERCPPYEHLRYVELVDEIPRSSNGKVQRRDLREQAVARRPRPLDGT
ncbi:acyl--CoA ligase [Spongiactinospora rosea]|uniref:Acyl--CoA ligase n=1 Tax=Spongiactinospora rosea TaxID=2248750 RepID=A0A366M1L3_9ACTN|nr:class I adenylate-forming enzyme family protein [Spongiactinospora rosea]RBQ20071.1 acyl--CoA ligase [Spongiactinospora rosea]